MRDEGFVAGARTADILGSHASLENRRLYAPLLESLPRWRRRCAVIATNPVPSVPLFNFPPARQRCSTDPATNDRIVDT